MKTLDLPTLRPADPPKPELFPPKQPSEELTRKRQMVADLCRFMGVQLTGRGHVSARDARDAALLAKAAALLSPRERQTLDRLLAGDSEKQIAVHLGVSPHTVHVYVKNLYRQFDVCARGELLARFVNPSNHRI